MGQTVAVPRDWRGQSFGLTARGYHRVLKVARTIADLEGATGVRDAHVSEALQFRGTLVCEVSSAVQGKRMLPDLLDATGDAVAVQRAHLVERLRA